MRFVVQGFPVGGAHREGVAQHGVAGQQGGAAGQPAGLVLDVVQHVEGGQHVGRAVGQPAVPADQWPPAVQLGGQQRGALGPGQLGVGLVERVVDRAESGVVAAAVLADVQLGGVRAERAGAAQRAAQRRAGDQPAQPAVWVRSETTPACVAIESGASWSGAVSNSFVKAPPGGVRRGPPAPLGTAGVRRWSPGSFRTGRPNVLLPAGT